jgi:8-oxo-dGTP pyrophosphatase MutT (NUDIX family)
MGSKKSKRFDRLAHRIARGQPKSTGTPSRFGAIPYRQTDGEIVFLMVTSRGTGQWIFPKGRPVDGLTPAESAAEEAYEETGVRGSMGSTPVGHFSTLNTRPNEQAPILIEMYPLEVTKQYKKYPEKAERQRQWATLDEVRNLLSEPGSVALAEKIAGNLRA